jgi:hypothetical protein
MKFKEIDQYSDATISRKFEGLPLFADFNDQ